MLKLSKNSHNISEATSIKYNNLVYDLKQQGEDIITLSLGEAFFDIPLYDMSDLPYPNLYHYSHSKGIPELRKKISDYYFKHYDVKTNPDKEIIITAGSKAVIYLVLKSILDKDDEAIIPEPAWVSYTEQVKICNAKPITIPYWEKIFNYEKYITKNTKIIIINNPHNPSGKVYKEEELYYLLGLAKKHNIFLLSDEAYSDFTINEKFHSLGTLDPEKTNTIICNSISKNFGISGWRIGYLISNEKIVNEVSKLNQHIITCPATILELYLVKYFEKIIEITTPQIKKVVEQRNQIAEFMDSIGLKHLPGTATFYFFVSINPTSLTSEEFCTKLLIEEKISTVPGIGYGKTCDSFIRVSVGTEPIEKIKYALLKIKELIEKTTS